jgi:hypothetical protein
MNSKCRLHSLRLCLVLLLYAELDKDVALPKLPLNCGPKLVYVASIPVSYKQLSMWPPFLYHTNNCLYGHHSCIIQTTLHYVWHVFDDHEGRNCILTDCVLPLMCDTKFHAHVKQNRINVIIRNVLYSFIWMNLDWAYAEVAERKNMVSVIFIMFVS